MATDRPKTFKDLIEAAEHGDPRAQFELGRRHFRGEGAPLDRLEAER
jgi:TPR repeat protein